MAFQPGFASTGHSAQGKTLPKVLAWLHEGGFAAYVSASRPNSRFGLAIIQPVTLSDLNKPLPYDLIQETKCHIVMEHNTLIRYGIKSGNIMPVPDPEEEHGKKFHAGKAIFKDATSTSLKRSLTNPPTQQPRRKKKKTSHVTYLPTCEFMPYSCQWSTENWSCSYDSIFTAFFAMYHHLDANMSQIWKTKNECVKLMGKLFDNLTQINTQITSVNMNVSRDQLRIYLAECNAEQFPLTGHALVDPTNLIKRIEQSVDGGEKMLHITSCSTCDYFAQIQDTLKVRYIPTPTLWSSFAEEVGANLNATETTTETWFQILLATTKSNTTINITNQCFGNHASHCNEVLHHSIQFQDYLPPAWTLEINPLLQPKTIPTLYFFLKTTNGNQLYSLRAIIYTGSQHFTARFISNSNIWNYDGAKNNGQPYFENNTSNDNWRAEQLLTFEGRDMYLLIYGC